MTTVVRTITDLRAGAHGRERPVHLVPTMGALHAGHRALLRAARAEAATVVMSVFVNPLQFNDPSDLARYPRSLDADVAAAQACGVDVVWAPGDEEMYPRGTPLTTVRVAGVSEPLEGAFRPGHFDGVATVVAKLFHQVAPDAAWFGRKDAQQLAVIRRMVDDLDVPVEVRDHPTVREPDGLAISSRNSYLSPEERREAVRLSRGLFAAADLAEAGERDARTLEVECGEALRAAPGPGGARHTPRLERGVLVGSSQPAGGGVTGVEDPPAYRADPRLEYAALVRADDFRALPRLEGRAVLAAAAVIGPARLIDNVVLEVGADGRCVADRGVLGHAVER